MQILDRLLTPGSSHGRTGQALAAKGILVHYVGNPGSTAIANRNWFENGAGGAHTSAHYVIGLNGEILRLLPEEERGQHAGKAYAPQYEAQAKTNNGTYIGIECCHPDAEGKFNSLTYKSLVELCADICSRRHFNPMTHVLRHYDVTGKECPLYYKRNAAAWTQLRSDVQCALQPKFNASGAVKVTLDGQLWDISAKNINGRWYVTLDELGGLQVKLADILSSAGYATAWDEPNETVVAVKK